MDNNASGYGYVDDSEAIAKTSNLNFGLNVCQMKKFGHITNAGKDGAEAEALDIMFLINGTTEKGYRLFPVTKAFGKNNEEITDPKSPEMQEAYKQFNAIMTHILGCFVPKSDIITAFSKPVANFKEYCTIAKGLLPADGRERNLDIFLQYQWQISGDNTQTFLDIPRKMKNGIWLVPHVEPVGAWKLNRLENPADSEKKAIFYTDDANNVHPFVRNGWFANSNFANQIREGNDDSAISAAPAAGVSSPDAGGSNDAAAPSTNWD